jgi:hypothetical protein
MCYYHNRIVMESIIYILRRLGELRLVQSLSCLQGEPIPEKLQISYGATHFTRKIGITSIEEDRIIIWQCQDCGGFWDR